jgi:hypothetical protein
MLGRLRRTDLRNRWGLMLMRCKGNRILGLGWGGSCRCDFCQHTLSIPAVSFGIVVNLPPPGTVGAKDRT